MPGLATIMCACLSRSASSPWMSSTSGKLVLARRIGTGVHHQRRDAAVEEVIDAGESGFAESDDDDHGLPHLQGGEAKQHQHEGDDPEAHDDARLRPALLLIVVMDGAMRKIRTPRSL